MHKNLWLLVGMTWAVTLSLQRLALAAEDVAKVLQRQSQEMLDAITSGSAAVWDRYLDAKVTYTSEDGTVQTKSQLLEQIKPLPKGVSGVLKVTDFKATVHGPVAVATYVSDEHETYHGHKLHCQYRTTDTWMKTPAGWRLIASQVLALRTDPPAVTLKPRQMEEYIGRYSLAPDITYEIRRTPGGLEGQQSGRKAEPLRAEAPDVLFVPGKTRYRKIVLRGPDGHVKGFVERREAWDLEWTRLPQARPPHGIPGGRRQ